MRIIILTETLRLGGAETQAVALANALSEAGHETAFASGDGPLRARLSRAVAFHALPSPGPAFLHGLRHVFADFRPDVAHAQGATLAFLSFLARFPRRIPAIVLTHHIKRPARIGNLAWGFMVGRACDRIIALTGEKADSFRSDGVPGGKIALIPNFVDTGSYAKPAGGAERRGLRGPLSIPEEGLVVAVAARLIPEKGIDMFIRLVGAAATRLNAPVTGVIMGDGPDRARLEKMAAAVPAPAAFVFTGYRDDIRPYLASADAALFPTRYPQEVLPMFLIESAAAGVPAICSDLRANREVVSEGENGLLADGEAGLADALVRLLSDPALRARMGEAGRALARERFDRAPVIKRLLETYSAALAERK